MSTDMRNEKGISWIKWLKTAKIFALKEPLTHWELSGALNCDDTFPLQENKLV